jgi:hypothetical protein
MYMNYFCEIFWKAFAMAGTSRSFSNNCAEDCLIKKVFNSIGWHSAV